MELIVVGLSHRTAPVAAREAFAVAAEAVPELAARLVREEAVGEAVVLSTCNRVELWAVAREAGDVGRAAAEDVLRRALSTERGLDAGELQRFGYAHHGEAAVRHVMRVCASLDSLVVGEAQILAQAREAFDTARAAGSVGPVLGRLVPQAFRAAKAVRTDTGIAEETVSIGSVAVELARRIFPTLSACQVLVIGAGKMGRVTARALSRHGVREVVVTNRSPARAEQLARDLGWRACPFDQLDALLAEADVVLTCTGADRAVLDKRRMGLVMRRRKYRPIFLVDIAVPRDVAADVGELEGVFLYNIDDLEAVSRDHLALRQGEARRAEVLIDAAVAGSLQDASERGAAPLLSALRARAEAIARGELERARGRRLSGLDPAQTAAVEATVEAILNKWLHPAMAALRTASDRSVPLAEAAALLFGLDPSSGLPAAGPSVQPPVPVRSRPPDDQNPGGPGRGDTP
jgi:glutamyl-tRNA reductase